jgi:hypothetical protein
VTRPNGSKLAEKLTEGLISNLRHTYIVKLEKKLILKKKKTKLEKKLRAQQ